MPEYYYSSTSFLAFCLNHYFYGGIHYAWLAGDFYPYRQPNPKSSNPLLSYIDLYEPWKDADPYDKFVAQHRLALKKGIAAQEKANVISGRTARRLRRVIDKVDLKFYCPIVYRVDISAIPVNRRQVAGSGSTGSNEYLVADLAESEFDILFLDFRGDADFDMLNAGIAAGGVDALATLEVNCP